jgi:hypothetical protein
MWMGERRRNPTPGGSPFWTHRRFGVSLAPPNRGFMRYVLAAYLTGFAITCGIPERNRYRLAAIWPIVWAVILLALLLLGWDVSSDRQSGL